ncbi:MAG: ATP-dependent helicase [Patescibacteria group bacterium]|nr:ATP-dependent helicase [Patescibacteria group bacterium]MCL5095231.1 ATP-dependent helicase [Patescibacteria group bacterium]
MTDEEKKLNSQQLEAVQYGQGPLLIIAGAGTGKTTVITERIKYLVAQGLAKPSEILALTFTDKAAREMEERVDVIMPYGFVQTWISTFHAFGDRLLRQEGLHLGLDPRYNLLTGAETVQFIRKNLFKFDLKYFRPLGNPTKFIDGLIQHFSRLKDEDINHEQYLQYVQELKIEDEERAKARELAMAFKTYEELKIKEGVFDFSDLIAYTLKLFRTRKNILKKYQEQFKYLLVDEFQDTNLAQYELLKILAPPQNQPNLTVVGDDSQSIYKFRGAAISNILQFMDDYKFAKQVILTKNYRSTQTILDHAYKLIKNNDPDTLEVKLKISKNLKKVREVKEVPLEFLHADRVENEAEMVAKQIENLKLKIKTLDYKDFAILLRANNQADPFIRALVRKGIPYQFLGPGMLFKQNEIKDLIAYLKILTDFEDSVAMYRILSLDFFDLDPRDLAAINNFAKKNNLSLFEACEQIEKIFVSPKTREKIKKIVGMIVRHLGLLKKETAGQILYFFLEDSGLLKKLSEYKNPTEARKVQNISKFFDKLKTYETDHEDASVFAVSDWIDLSMELGESPLASDLDWTEVDAVNLLTVHSSKGLEFPIVFLVNLVSQRFPTTERKEQIPIPEALIKEILPVGDYHLEEERRLFYVGMTRARDLLFLTAADYYGEGKRERKLSPFIFETMGEGVLKAKPSTSSSQLSLLEWAKPKEQPTISNLQPFTISYLSFSQIEAFNNCPLQYRYRFLQKIPVPQRAAQSFGDSVHKTLRDFYEKLKIGQKVNKEDLLSIFENNWSSLGYDSKAREVETKKEGIKMLEEFYKRADLKIVPKDLEKSFSLKMTPDLKIVGKIDRIDEHNGRLEIIDYKTGKVSSQKDIDQSLQMTIYALAISDKEFYHQKPEDLLLSFYFLETQEKKSTKRTTPDIEKAKEEIIEKAKEIAKSDFPAKPGPLCAFCDFKLICEAWQ